MTDPRYLLRPLLPISAGGAGNDCNRAFCDRIVTRFGTLPACVRPLAIDWTTDPPIGFAPSETGRIALPADCPALAARMNAGEPDAAWLSHLVRADVLARYSGHEAAQVPAYCRAALAWTAANGLGDGQPTWLDSLRVQLIALAPGGAAIHETVAHSGAAAGWMRHGAITVIFIVGAEGGTGSGALIPLAIAARWLAASMGMKLECHAWIVTGHYRPKDGDEEDAKAALSHALDIDIEWAMSRGAALRFPLGPALAAEVNPPLFDAVFREEVSGRLMHDYDSVVAQCAEDLLFAYTTTAAEDLMRNQVNKTVKPRLRGIAQQAAWPAAPRKKEAYGD